MLATVDQARRGAVACTDAQPEVWPYRPISDAWDYARELFPPARSRACAASAT